MQKWLDRQLKLAVSKPASPATLEIDFGPVIMPWLLKYGIPLSVGLIAAGWVAHWYLAR
jgi:hypothetical protein